MTKEELAFCIARAMYKDRLHFERVSGCQVIQNYFLNLEMSDLIGVATQYGINVYFSDNL